MSLLPAMCSRLFYTEQIVTVSLKQHFQTIKTVISIHNWETPTGIRIGHQSILPWFFQ